MTESGDKLREAAVEVLRTLAGAGHTAYFAGGCVRDRLMGREPVDYDVATDARPETVGGLFRRAHHVGESFGVMLVRHRSQLIHVATFRTDGVYSDGRHPDSVSFSDAEHDARRRDFTINGLFEDPLADEIIDYVGGRADLEARIVRAIGDPAARLREDALRSLRAVRFAARFEFAIEEGTADAIRAAAADLRGVSRERIGQELKLMLTHPNRAMAAWEVQYLGLDHAVLGEEPLTAAPARLGRLPDDAPYPAALAAWLLDRHGDRDPDPVARARRWSVALLLSNAEQAALAGCLEAYATLRDAWEGLGVARQKRLAASGDFEPALMVLAATDRQAFVDVRRRVIELAESGLAPAPLVTGDDLIKLGLAPGPDFRRVLDAVYDAQLEGGIGAKAEALDLARALSRTSGQG